MMVLREDWKVAKWLALASYSNAESWMRTPMLDASSTDPDDCGRGGGVIMPGSMDNSPWDDVIVKVPCGEPQRCFVRLTRSPSAAHDEWLAECVWIDDGVDRCAVCHIMWSNTSGRVTDCRDLTSRTYPDLAALMPSLSADIVEHSASVSGFAIARIAECSRSSAFPVEVSPAAPPCRAERKRLALTPWLRADAPRVIILSHEGARAHGQPASQGGSHASPRLHQRRGHWATLRHEKFRRNDDGTPRKVWVRPAWVGEREWQYQGNTYRVVTADAQAGE